MKEWVKQAVRDYYEKGPPVLLFFLEEGGTLESAQITVMRPPEMKGAACHQKHISCENQ